jgi:type I restriction enzyme R subunit
MPDLNPEQLARQEIDTQLVACGWVVQDRKAIDFNASPGIAVREYPTDTGPADYVLFVDKHAVGVIEAKKEEVGQNITVVEDQTAGLLLARIRAERAAQDETTKRLRTRRATVASKN